MPRVSAVIAVHNGEGFIHKAILSVLAQTYRDVEILVVDDNSSDQSAAIAASYGSKVRLISVQHGNTQATRNAAISASDSDFIGILDQDDAWHPTKLARQIALMDADPHLGLCYTDTRCVDTLGQELPDKHNPLRIPRDQTEALGMLLRLNIMAASTVLIRRQALAEVGAFDTRFHLTGDWDLWLRIAEVFPLAALPQVLLDYCWHDHNLSHQQIAMLTEAVQVQEAALERVSHHPYWARDPGLAAFLPAARRKLASRHAELGNLLARQGQRTEALNRFRRAIAIEPWIPRAWSGWIKTYLTQSSC